MDRLQLLSITLPIHVVVCTHKNTLRVSLQLLRFNRKTYNSSHAMQRSCVPIIADEIYANMVFSGSEFVPIATLTTYDKIH